MNWNNNNVLLFRTLKHVSNKRRRKKKTHTQNLYKNVLILDQIIDPMVVPICNHLPWIEYPISNSKSEMITHIRWYYSSEICARCELQDYISKRPCVVVHTMTIHKNAFLCSLTFCTLITNMAIRLFFASHFPSTEHAFGLKTIYSNEIKRPRSRYIQTFVF